MADLSEARGRHSATLLANGTVLIAGGQDVAGRPLAASEIYDPATGIYSPLASPLPMPVWGHTAARLDDGTVLIAGGNGEGGLPVADAQLFDPAAAAFIRVGYLSTPRSQHTGTLLGDGRVLLAGGTDGATAVARLELYDPAARTISPAPSALLAPRQNHIATRLIDGRVLIAGGSNSSGMVGTAELYDPSSGTVATAGVLNVARELASGATLLDGTVLVAGGRSAENLDLDMAEVYSPVANTFTPATFTGTCVNNTTPCTFTVTVQDNGEPGSQGPNKDKFSITVVASPAEMVTLRDLRRGNIQIHQSQFESESLVASAAEGIFPSGASLNGVQLSGLQVGKGIITSGTGTARGDFQTLLLGTSMLGQPQNINVEGSASSGSRNADGSVTFAGVSTVDMGDGTVPLSGVPFSVTVTPQALALTLGLSALPSATVTAGRIKIE